VLLKILRLEEHIRYAAAHGLLEKVDRYLQRLPEREWAHLSDFGRGAAQADAMGELGE
jgi:hypothetical protein